MDDLSLAVRSYTNHLSLADSRVHAHENLSERVNAQLASQREELQLRKEVHVLLGVIQSKIQADAQQLLVDLLNLGIQSIYGEGLQVYLEEGSRGSHKTLEYRVKEANSDVPLRSSHGGGITQIVGIISRVAFIISSGGRRLLVLDEPFGAVSGEYQSAVVEFLKVIVDSLGFQVILVTHNSEFAGVADRVYQTDRGRLEVVDME